MQLNNENFSIRINQDGVRKLMDELESDIMEVFWASEEPSLTVKDVYKVLSESKNVLCGSVTASICKLVDKGFLSIVDTVGLANCYAVTCTKQELIQSAVEHVMQVFFMDFPLETSRSIASYGRDQLSQKISEFQ